MRVLAIASYGVLGGAELALVRFLAERPPGVEASVLVLGEGGLPARLTAGGIPVWHAPSFRSRPTPRDAARFTRALLALLGDQRPDVVWAVGIKAATMAMPACRLARTPIVWHKVDFSLDRWLARPLAAAVDGVVAVSAAAAGALGEALARRRLLGVVGPPVALAPAGSGTPASGVPAPGRASRGGPVLGTLGSLLPTKGHKVLIEAAALLRDEFPALSVAIAGAPTSAFPGYREQLLARARELGISDRVVLPGFVEPRPFLEGLDVYVSASYHNGAYGSEGLSGAMLEASWVGLPVVATRAGGTPEGVIDGVTGVLVEPGDASALAGGLRAVLSDREAARRMGEAGARFARERFAPAPLAAELFSLLGRAAR
jgi:glycosyltransferase involved in cell wall biosynthesis